MKYLIKIKQFLLLSLRYRSFKFRKFPKLLTTIVLAGLGLISALIVPGLSQPEILSQPQLLAQQGKEFYEVGNLEQAIETWEKAAEFYELEGDLDSRTANLINTATAQQALGLYEEFWEFSKFKRSVTK